MKGFAYQSSQTVATSSVDLLGCQTAEFTQVSVRIQLQRQTFNLIFILPPFIRGFRLQEMNEEVHGARVHKINIIFSVRILRQIRKPLTRFISCHLSLDIQ
jgi:hypothetical protein